MKAERKKFLRCIYKIGGGRLCESKFVQLLLRKFILDKMCGADRNVRYTFSFVADLDHRRIRLVNIDSPLHNAKLFVKSH